MVWDSVGTPPGQSFPNGPLPSAEHIGAGLPCNPPAQAAPARKTPWLWRPPKSIKINKNLWKSMKINENPDLGLSGHPSFVILSPNVQFWMPPTSIFSIRARRQRRQPVNKITKQIVIVVYNFITLLYK